MPDDVRLFGQPIRCDIIASGSLPQGSGYGKLFHFKPGFTDSLAAALAAYPQARKYDTVLPWASPERRAFQPRVTWRAGVARFRSDLSDLLGNFFRDCR